MVAEADTYPCSVYTEDLVIMARPKEAMGAADENRVDVIAFSGQRAEDVVQVVE